MNSKNVLQSHWNIWFDRRKPKDMNKKTQYKDRLIKIGTFNTVEDFIQYYVYFKSPSQLPKSCDIFLYRKYSLANKSKRVKKKLLYPMWEMFPKGGQWMISLKKSTEKSKLDKIWEKLVFAVIGEEFISDVVGIGLNKRDNHLFVCVINETCDNEKVTESIVYALQSILRINKDVIVQYKPYHQAIKDGFSHANALYYRFPSLEEFPQQQEENYSYTQASRRYAVRPRVGKKMVYKKVEKLR